MLRVSHMEENAMKFEATVQVRFGDLDCMGHVNNAVYFTYMEQARVEFCNQFPDLDFRKSDNRSGKSFILASISCDFKRPVTMGQDLVVAVSISKIGTASFEMTYQLKLNGGDTLVAEGRSVQVYYDYGLARPLPLTPDIKSSLKRFIQE